MSTYKEVEMNGDRARSGLELWHWRVGNGISVWYERSVVPIDKAGRVVLPKNVREELAIVPGDVLEITVREGEVTLRPRRESRGFVRQGKALVFSSGSGSVLTNEGARKVLEQVRLERAEESVRLTRPN